MANHAVAEKGRGPLPLGAVEELVGDDDMSRGDRLLHAADRRDRDDPLHAELFHAIDIGPVGHFRGEQAMALAVTRQEDHLHPVEHAGDKTVARCAEGGVEGHFLDVGQPLDFVEAAAADNADGGLGHGDMVDSFSSRHEGRGVRSEA